MVLKLSVNLASEPFRRDRPVFVASIALAVLLAGLLALQVYIIFSERDQLADTRVTMARLEAQVTAMGYEQAKLDGVLRRPENAEVLERSIFLNALLLRKGISWTKIFSDLEGVMPHNVRLMSIRLPQITSQNEIQLDMVVGAQTGEPVLQFLMQLEGAPQFGATSLNSWLPPSQTEPLYRYRVSVNYVQKL